MRYIEKDLAPPEVDPDRATKARLSKLPGFLMGWMLRANLERIRAGMGGVSRDITRQTIVQQDRPIPGPAGDLRVRVYAPEGPAVRPLLMFHHGGGFFGGSLEAVEQFCRGVADQADAVVVSVDYRLAPEHRFPAGVEDCYHALRWSVARAEELGIDPDRVAVGGDSAGGNLAAVMAILAAERGEVSVHRQVLIYPVVDQRLTNARENYPASPGLASGLASIYLDDRRDADHPHVSPAALPSLADLPPTLLAVGEHDDLRHQATAYAEALDEAGVDVTFLLYKGANHAFIDHVGNNANADDLVTEAARFVAS